MGVVVCGHRGSGDHGCEDRLRGTCRLLAEKPDVYSACMEEDWHYGLGELAGLCRQSLEKTSRHGGDLVLLDGASAAGRKKSVLWGWSCRGGELSRRTAKRLAACQSVVVMDGRSLEILRRSGLEKKAKRGPDLSFLVERHIRPLRGAFRQDTVGLCLSPVCGQFESAEGLMYRSYCGLIRYILAQTPFQVALIPYCVQRGRNDLLLLSVLKEQFRESGRVFLREDGDSRGLRGDISLCRWVVGAAGAVAAWSCAVPALCLGANGRSMGLAQELFGTWQEAVVPIASLQREEDLTARFQSFLRREDRLRRDLEEKVPLRRQQSATWDWETMRLQS